MASSVEDITNNPFIVQHVRTEQEDELATDSDNDDAQQNRGVMIHLAQDNSKSLWTHVPNLDNFFILMYRYLQKHGFCVMMTQETLELSQFVFVVFFLTFTFNCVNYPVLFKEVKPASNHTKLTFDDVVFPIGECVSSFSRKTWLLLCSAIVFWIFRMIKVIYHGLQCFDIKKFYNLALKIPDSQINNYTWHEVQAKTLSVQSEHQMCIHKEQLTELDIYHRILRFQNYMVALMNKSLLPSTICLPIVGETVCFSRGLSYNIEMILFRGPWAPFENNWHLKEEYKRATKRNELSQKMSRQIFWVAVGNLLFSPLVFLWSLMVLFFSYADLIKRDPSALGIRCWSQYGKLYMRHFNELEHELQARLNRAYKPATRYMASFSSPLLAVIARNIISICGGPLVIFVILAIYDEDVAQVGHIFLIMWCVGILVILARACIPDENMIWCPEQLMTAVLAHTHYLPASWRGQAHTSRVRDQFAHFFQLRGTYLLIELLSPITTPFILMFCLRPRSLDIVDFFRNFTVSVVGVGDVCSFAQMDVRKHGNADWQPTHSTNADMPEVLTPLCKTNQYTQGDNGKTELSLVHFTLTNPGWKMPAEAKQFVHGIKRHAMHDIDQSKFGANTAMEQSLYSVKLMGNEYASIVQSIIQAQHLLAPNQMVFSSLQSHYGYSEPRNPFSPTTNLPHDPIDVSSHRRSSHLADINEDDSEANARGAATENARRANYERTTQSILGASMGKSMIGGMSRREGPPNASQEGLLFSIGGAGTINRAVATDITATDMCLSTLYLHELHHRQIMRRTGTVPTEPAKSWQQPHQTASLGLSTAEIAFHQPSTSLSAAAERTPLLGPKKS